MGTTSQQPADRRVGPALSGVTEESGLDRDEVFHVLRNRRRRFAIHHLKRDPEPVDVGDLATQVAAWENDVPAEEVTSKQRRRVYNALKQTHIPKLTETGLLREERNEVELTDEAEKLDIYLELVPEKDIRWSEYYLGLAAVGLAALAVIGFDVGPFAVIADIAAGVFLGVALLVSAVVHYRYQHVGLVGGDERPPELRGE